MFRIGKSQLVVALNTISSFSANSAKVEDVAKQLQLQSKKNMIFVGNPEGRGVDVLIKALHMKAVSRRISYYVPSIFQFLTFEYFRF